MFTTPIERLVLSIGSTAMTEFFIVVILLALVAGMISKRLNKAPNFTQYVPTLLTTLGILGTFVGIVAGLLAFDVENIDGSIAGLLGGMKTAFITSLVGMATAILFKTVVTVGWLDSPNKAELKPDEVGAAELHKVLVAQLHALDLVRKGIGSGDESSLTGQLKLLRSDNNDHQRVNRDQNRAFEDRLWIKLQEFADMMAGAATEQVIEALKQVITDFNHNLTEQFGENFKRLNESVTDLVEWQERYREQIAQMIEQYSQGVTAITQTAESVDTISTESKRIPESMDALREVLTVNQHQIEELNRHLEAFSGIRDRAVEAVPEIRSQIDATLSGVQEASREIASGMQIAGNQLQSSIIQGAEDFENSSRRVNESLQQSSDVVRQNSEQLTQQFTDFASDINGKLRDIFAEVDKANNNLSTQFEQTNQKMVVEIGRSMDEFGQNMQGIRQQFAQHLESMAGEQTEQTKRVLNGLRHAAEEALSSTGESLRRQVEALDQARQREMEEIAREMGSALASISGKFVTDYARLVEAMRRITEA